MEEKGKKSSILFIIAIVLTVVGALVCIVGMLLSFVTRGTNAAMHADQFFNDSEMAAKNAFSLAKPIIGLVISLVLSILLTVSAVMAKKEKLLPYSLIAFPAITALLNLSEAFVYRTFICLLGTVVAAVFAFILWKEFSGGELKTSNILAICLIAAEALLMILTPIWFIIKPLISNMGISMMSTLASNVTSLIYGFGLVLFSVAALLAVKGHSNR